MQPECSRGLAAVGVQTGQGDEPVFSQLWEARAFAIVVCLSEGGYFSWPEWVDALSRHVAQASRIEAEGGRARSDYEQWVDAAEELLVARGLTSLEQLRARRLAAWPIDTNHAVPRA